MATFFELASQQAERHNSGKAYLEFLRVPALSAGVYELAAGALDAQSPHLEDELYYVVKGRARMRVGKEDREVQPQTVIFVPARVEHRFYDIAEPLTLLVFFAPAES